MHSSPRSSQAAKGTCRRAVPLEGNVQGCRPAGSPPATIWSRAAAPGSRAAACSAVSSPQHPNRPCTRASLPVRAVMVVSPLTRSAPRPAGDPMSISCGDYLAAKGERAGREG